MTTRRKQQAVKNAPRARTAHGLCFRFMCWDAQTNEHTLELVLCYRCQHSLAWGADPRRQPFKKFLPGRRAEDPPVIIAPVGRSCEWCAVFGWEPTYEADVIAAREQERAAVVAASRVHIKPAIPSPAVDVDGQVSLF